MHAPLFLVLIAPNRPKPVAKPHHLLELAAVESYVYENLSLILDLEGSAQNWEPLCLQELCKALYFHSSL